MDEPNLEYVDETMMTIVTATVPPGSEDEVLATVRLVIREGGLPSRTTLDILPLSHQTSSNSGVTQLMESTACGNRWSICLGGMAR